MEVTIKCERCGTEKVIEIKLPKFCSPACRIAAFGESKRKKTVEITQENVNIQQETPTGDTVVSTQEAGGDIGVQQ